MSARAEESAAWVAAAKMAALRDGFLCSGLDGSLWDEFPHLWDRMRERVRAHAHMGTITSDDDPWSELAVAPPERNQHARVILALLLAEEAAERAP